MLTLEQARERNVCQVCEKPYIHCFDRLDVYDHQHNLVGVGHPWCMSREALLAKALELSQRKKEKS